VELPSYFSDFLKNIRPSKSLRDKMRDEHQLLRDRLSKDQDLGPIVVGTFIQGSYRRFTGVTPGTGSQADVDVVAVTSMSESQYTSRKALDRFIPFLEEHYPKKYTPQGRSWAIDVNGEISLDLVPTSAPSEAVVESLRLSKAASWNLPDEPDALEPTSYGQLLLEGTVRSSPLITKAALNAQWKSEPLRIPDREANNWDDTHPLEQIRWTWEKSSATEGHYVNVVKSLKWWRKETRPEPKYPKSYPLEHMIGNCCPDAIATVAVGVTRSLELMEETYRPFVNAREVPYLADRGVPGHNVLHRLTADDFATFLGHVKKASEIARKALDADTVKKSADLWRQLFGDEFPEAPDDDSGGGGGSSSGGFTPRTKVSTPSEGRFAACLRSLR
jgi:hypothetical protein